MERKLEISQLELVRWLTDFRNGLQSAIEATDNFLTVLGLQVQSEVNVQNIKWETVQGSKGLYDRADSQDTPDFKLLVKEIEEHGGRMQKGGYFYWKFDRSETVGRKERKR